MRSPISQLVFSSLLLCTLLLGSSNAALVFAVKQGSNAAQEGNLGNIFTLTNASSFVDFSVLVRRDDFDSGGDHLATFAFRVRTSAPAVAGFTQATLAGVPADYVGGSTTASAIGVTATAAGTYVNRPTVYVLGTSADLVSLATFRLQGLTSGSVTITIEEATVDNGIGPGNPGAVDFLLGAASGVTTGQDRTGFSGVGNTIGIASTQFGTISNITAVPEPSSMLLVCASIAGAGWRLRRARKAS